MLNRAEIKLAAKQSMKQQWGLAIGAPLLFFVISFAGGVIGWIPIIGWIILWGTVFFVDFPLTVGLFDLFRKISKNERADIGDLFMAFKGNFMRKVGGMAWMYLWILLWSLVGIVSLFIPTIIKYLSYSMTPYILAEYPKVEATNALKLSMRMTNGYKGQLFVLGLSFIGWFILGAFTLGILTIVFVIPYYYTTYAAYYEELKRRALESGTIGAAELGVAEHEAAEPVTQLQ